MASGRRSNTNRASAPPGGSSSSATSQTLARSNGERAKDDDADEEELLRELAVQQKRVRIAELRQQIQHASTQLLRLQAEGGQPAHDSADGAALPQGALIGAAPGPPRGPIPKAKDPHTFEGKGRSDFNQWVRDIERNFNRAPGVYSSDLLKTDFAADWMGKHQQDKWERFLAHFGEGCPSWGRMKQVMLDTMGSAEERRQAARDRQGEIQQGNRTPTEVLDELKECWDELEEDRPDRMILDFYSSLSAGLRSRLSHNPTPPSTIEEAEDRANTQYRLWKEQNASRDRKRAQSSATTEKSGRNDSGKRQTTRRSPPTEGKKGRNSPGRTKPADLSTIQCYGCQRYGHKKPACPFKHEWADEAGKDKPTLKGSGG
jgi:hypothetical protein